MSRARQRLDQLRRLATYDPADAAERQATSPTTKIALRQLQHAVRDSISRGVPLGSLREYGFRVFSQDDEDGILAFLLAVLGVDRGRFIDIGAADCISSSNCANLALNLGFHGVFIDADPDRIARGSAFYASHPDTRTFPPKFVTAFVSKENVDGLIRGAGLDGDVDVLSIDVDGNDPWIWQGVTCARPKIVVIETHPELGLDDVASPYRADYDYRHAAPDAPVGASPTAMVRIAGELGYRLVGSNRYGFNAVFLRTGLAEDLIPTVGPEDLLGHDWSREPD